MGWQTEKEDRHSIDSTGRRIRNYLIGTISAGCSFEGFYFSVNISVAQNPVRSTEYRNKKPCMPILTVTGWKCLDGALLLVQTDQTEIVPVQQIRQNGQVYLVPLAVKSMGVVLATFHKLRLPHIVLLRITKRSVK